MQYLDLTLPTAAENLALDEALLEEAEAGGEPTETLRLWEPRQPLVVVGRSSRVGRRSAAGRLPRSGHSRAAPRQRRGGRRRRAGLPDVRLGAQLPPAARAARRLPRPIAGCWARWPRRLAAYVPGVQCRGTSDLAMGERKFSGNSARCRRDHLLYHGTLLYDFPLELIERCLAMPPRMPDYRVGRPHEGFVANLPLEGRDDPAGVDCGVRRPRALRRLARRAARPDSSRRSTAGRSGTGHRPDSHQGRINRLA